LAVAFYQSAVITAGVKLARLPDGSPEIFHTLQGEGASMGTPAIFIRSSRCNLHCVWCDTDYTWNWEGTTWPHQRDAEPGYRKYQRKEQTLVIEPEEIAQIVRALPCKRLVLTGGEPLLQQHGWIALLDLLNSPENRYAVEVETNGTLLPLPALDRHVTQYNVSPKLGNSGNDLSLRIQPAVLRWFGASPKTWLKFVIAQREDLAEVLGLINELELPQNQIILMPEGRSPEVLNQTRLWLADTCRDLNFRFSDRLHLHLWGPARAR
jgi:organic radical activating enzyme